MGEWKAFKKTGGIGWKELEREAGTGWKALEWEAAIDAGAPAISRQYSLNGYTSVTKYNPVNADGKIDKVDIYVGQAGTFIIGIYEDMGSNNIKCKDSHNCGNLGLGLHSDIVVDLDCLTGEYIGCYTSDGKYVYDIIAADDRWYKQANCTTIGTTYAMTFSATDVMYSFYGSNY